MSKKELALHVLLALVVAAAVMAYGLYRQVGVWW
jgi:hypothetical protein